MTRAAAIGEHARVVGYALAGVEVRPAEDPAAARAAWQALAADVGLVLLTPAAHAAVADLLDERKETAVVVLPE